MHQTARNGGGVGIGPVLASPREGQYICVESKKADGSLRSQECAPGNACTDKAPRAIVELVTWEGERAPTLVRMHDTEAFPFTLTARVFEPQGRSWALGFPSPAALTRAPPTR